MMQLSLSRRALFKGRFSKPEPLPVRPPWAQPEHTFLDLCSRCDKCLGACESRILVRGDGGYPRVDFTLGECTFCRACENACPEGALMEGALMQDALTPPEPHAAPWHLTAHIDQGCLSANGITCRVCGDRCDARAIRFQLAVGGVANPIVDPAACTGCGACVAPCPAGIITIEHRSEHKAEEASI